MQTKLHSLWESIENIIIGYAVAILSQVIIFPWFGIDIPLSSNLLIGFYFSVISIARSYVLRRRHNRKITNRLKFNQLTKTDDYKVLGIDIAKGIDKSTYIIATQKPDGSLYIHESV